MDLVIHDGTAFLTHQMNLAFESEILEILKETGGMEREKLFERFKGKTDRSQLEKEFATLRHMEKVRGEKRDGKVFLRLW